MYDEPSVLIDGPWTHRTVSASGTRFHVTETGEGPLVLLLHGFPQFWWTWRAQLPVLAGAGYRAVAVDLRGYGASDKPPRGYDLVTLSLDAAGLIRALGASDAVVVGHGIGGFLGWTMASYYPASLRRLAVLSAPHPLAVRSVPGTGRGRALRHLLGYQVPVMAERRLLADGAARVGGLLRDWSGPGWPDGETERRYRDAFQIPKVAHCSLEYHRWLFRSQWRLDGYRYMNRMRRPVQTPVLQLHGALDPVVPPAAARAPGGPVAASHRWRMIDGAGHFLHEERPDQVNDVLLRWLKDPEPEG